MTPPDYKNSKIYAIRSPHTHLVYIGSTIVPLSKRMFQHKQKNNTCSSKAIIDAGDAYIELIENFPCETREQLHKREGEIIRTTPNYINKNIKVEKMEKPEDGYRGFIVYVEDEFFLVVSEHDKKTHKIAKKKGEACPVDKVVLENGIEIYVSPVPVTESRLFSACREYEYDKDRKKRHYEAKKQC